jgi:hypothetical protein
LEYLHAAQHDQAVLVANLASQEFVGRQTEQLVDDSAAENDSSERGPIEPARAETLAETNGVDELQTVISSPATTAFSNAETVDEPAREPEFVQSTAAAPVSFLERYAGMFEDESAEGAAESLQSPTQHELPHADRDETPHAHGATAGLHAGLGDEESVEQYMAKLMQRVRGESLGSGVWPATSSTEVDEREAPPATSFATQAIQPIAASGYEPWSTVATVDERASEPLLTNVEELKPKTPAPQFAADLQALRALANQSARHAIGVHTARKLRRNALTRFVIAVLATFAGLYLMVYATSWWSLQFFGACVALFASLYWAKLTFGSLLRAIQVGAFQHFGNDDGEDPLNPPLPIDVEH